MALQEILPIWLPFSLLLCFLYLYKKSSASKVQEWQLPPGPPRLPVIGNLHQLGEIPHQSLRKLSEKYGPVIFLQLGGVPTVVVSSSEAARQVLKVHDLASCSRPALTGPRMLTYNFRDIAFSPFGDYWRDTRKLCVLELFNPKRVQSFRYIHNEEVASMIDSISRSCSSPGSSVDLSEQLLSLIANIISRVAFGKSFQGSRLKEVIHETSVMLDSFFAADLFPCVGWIVDRLTGFSARLERNFRDLDDIYQKAIDEHLEGGCSKQLGQEDVLDVLLKIEKEQADSGGGQFTRDHIKGILMDVFVGGIDTPLMQLDLTHSLTFGDYWREMRKVCFLELFSARRVQSFRSVREEEVCSMIDSITRSCSSSGSCIDLSEKVLSLTANIICRVAFGQTFHGSNSRLKEVMHEASAMLGSFCAVDFFPYAGWIVDRLTGLSARLERSFLDLDDIYQKAIDEHLEGQGQEDIIDVLLKIETEQAESSLVHFTRDHIKAILMNIFTAGVDTLAITVVWAMSELVRDLRALKKAQEEVRNLIGSKGKVSEADVEHLDYLKLVVKETLRLHPPGPMLIPRAAISPFKINDYQIPTKTRIYVNVWGIGRDPNSWNEPEKFFPERFEGSGIDYKGQQNFEFLPFGGGRRGCPGMQMGLAMVDLTLANLLYHFDWKLPNGMKEEDLGMEESPALTLLRKGPLDLVPVKYNPSS